jgi:hypothetical protein
MLSAAAYLLGTYQSETGPIRRWRVAILGNAQTKAFGWNEG